MKRHTLRAILALSLILTGYTIGHHAMAAFDDMMENKTAQAIRMIGE